ncbi:metallophosphoesterase [Clostridium estertheticum]|uniref:Metallophosphoesterase n=1 Tax=Clostridium estertheticum TaxID=238834 RepID=A0AA47EIG1_9CLOT|nr:metallophosphoesterase [Clostridium estertheticum]MBU3153391.1 metallophosphoesterase [Clostridium estertheticum]MBU3198402.1 metallophosphoesterase [Clostridium estertheticum]WAG60796.1 metallophosphoesterase [Clostridium estertheticum]WAG65083.1 metallophosphoesterase [Clostridium estertheticum]
MNKLMLLVVALFFFLYGGINYYIGLRGWQNLGSHISFLNNKVYWIVIALIASAYIISMILSSYIPSVVLNTLNIVGSYWMGIMFYLILVLPTIDLIKFLNSKISFIPRNINEATNFSLVVSLVVVVFLTSLMAYGTWSARSPKVTKYDLNVNKTSSDLKTLKIIMVSDIHLGLVVDNKRLTVMVNKINELNPDIVLIPGDIIDSSLEPFVKQNMSDNFKRLKSKYGVYACLGNHDEMGSSVEEIVKTFNDSGIKVLRDKAILINNSFYVIGRDDISQESQTKIKRKNLSDIIEDLDKSKPLILMDHQPRDFADTQKNGIDLQVSGHTHRGQLFPANLITNLIFEIDYGYLQKNNSNFIVSSGYGTWGPPIRIGSRSEIVEINIDFKK